MIIPENSRAHEIAPGLNEKHVEALLSVEQCGRKGSLGYVLLYRAYVIRNLPLDRVLSCLLDLPSFYGDLDGRPGVADVRRALHSFCAALLCERAVHERVFKDFLSLGSRFWVDPALPYHTFQQSLDLYNAGVNLLRKQNGDLKTDMVLNLYTLAKNPASTLFHCAILHDDIDGIEDLYTRYVGFKKSFPSNLIAAFIAEADDHASKGLLIPDFPRVRERYGRRLAVKDYFEAIKAALEAEDQSEIDRIYERSMVTRCGLEITEALLGPVGNGAITNEVTLNFLCRQVNDGLDLYPLFLRLSYDIFTAMDLLEQPMNPMMVIHKCVTYMAYGRKDFALFLMMIPIDQMRNQHNGQDCFRQLYELTRDIRYITEIESLSSRGQIFLGNWECRCLVESPRHPWHYPMSTVERYFAENIHTDGKTTSIRKHFPM